MTDLFGEEVTVNPGLDSRGNPKGGYAAKPGTGPKGETCQSCKYYLRVNYHGKIYLKCMLTKPWTHGRGSDIKAGTPACAMWKSMRFVE